MTLAWLLLITGLIISAVAIYYSVVGLAAIFSAAVIPIIVMGSALEVAKLVCASWLKANWERAPLLMKTYMTVAVIVLMAITSMGIFGFLSKAHSDQNLISGDVQGKIAIYDEKIKTARDNIDANRKALKQMDEAVDQVMGRSQDEKGADKAVALRRGQTKERTRLLSEIAAEQKKISQLSEERAPIAAEVRKVEAEVGPLKYIAKFIYGDNGADQNMLEKAVTWVIVLIVIVFDPLAVIMLLAAQMTFGWHNRGRDPLADASEGDSPVRPEPVVDMPVTTVTEQTGVIAQEVTSVIPEAVIIEDEKKNILDDAKITLAKFVNAVTTPTIRASAFEQVKGFSVPKVSDVEMPGELKSYKPVVKLDQVTNQDEEIDAIGLEAWNKMIEEAEKAAEEEKTQANVIWTDELQSWRENNLEADIYEIQRAYDAGEIKVLPWEEDGKKFKILPELINRDTYVQNEEQTESHLWKETTEQIKSLSQDDYQEKVHQAKVRDIVKSINDGTVSIEDLNEDEVKAVEEYLKKESDDRENNDNQSA